MSVLRNQIGTEGLTAVIEFLPSQHTKRMLGSKSQRAAYVSTLLNSNQRPFIWEYFRPGTIETPKGEEAYYDEVMPHTFGRKLSLTPYMSETPWPISINSRPSCLLGVFQVVWHPNPILV